MQMAGSLTGSWWEKRQTTACSLFAICPSKNKFSMSSQNWFPCLLLVLPLFIHMVFPYTFLAPDRSAFVSFPSSPPTGWICSPCRHPCLGDSLGSLQWERMGKLKEQGHRKGLMVRFINYRVEFISDLTMRPFR